MSVVSRKLHIRGGLEHLPKSISLVGEGARRAGLSAARRDALESATREAYLAILDGGQNEGRKGTVEVEVSWDKASIIVSLVHAGPALELLFDRIPLDPRLVLMQHAVDEVRYVRDPRHGYQLSLHARLESRPARARRRPAVAPERSRARR